MSFPRADRQLKRQGHRIHRGHWDVFIRSRPRP